MNNKMSFDGKKASANNKSIIVFVIILLLSVVSAVTLAFFAGSDYASKWTMTSGKVKIEAVGKGNASIEDQTNSCKLEIEFDRDYGVLIPNMPIRLYANCKVYQSSTKPLLRANFRITLMDSYGNPLESSGNEQLEVDITSQIKEKIVDSDNWYYHADGYYYYVESEDGDNSILKEIDATGRDTIVPFLNGDEITFPKYVEDDFSGLSVKLKIVFQAIQNYIPDDDGNQIANTIANAQKIFNEF